MNSMTTLFRTFQAAAIVPLLAVVAVIHDLSLAARFMDRLVLMAEGRIIADGPPSDVLSDDRLASTYHIDAVRGARDASPYIVPWSRL